MRSVDFNLNRPVHMARRDAHFERALDLLNVATQDFDTAARMTHIDRIMRLLERAGHHARFSVQSPQALQQEKDFLHFLDLITDNVHSAQSMVRHQSHFEGEEGFLCQFLNAKPEECVLPAMHYRRRADDIFHGLWHLLRLAQRAYRSVQQTAVRSLGESEQSRYQRAYEATVNELNVPATV